MNQDYKTASSSVKLLEMKNFTAEHIKWLQGELKKPNNFIWDEGRKVMVNTQNGVDVIDIPSKEDKTGFLNAWLKVYNTCLATLDIDVKIICLKRNHVRKTYNQVVVGNYTPVAIPDDTTSVAYITALEAIINNYKDLYSKRNSAPTPVVKFQKHEVTLKPVEAPMMKPEPMPTKPKVVSHISDKLREEVKKEIKKESVYNTIKGEKIPDGDKLTKGDIENLKDASFVLATCTHLDKDANTFIYNVEKCMENGLNIGAYLNGKATDTDSAVKDSKKIIKLLNGIDIKGPVVYEINLDYLKNHDSEEDLDNMIKAYNGVASVLIENGYHVLISTDLDTGVLLERQIKRKNIPNVFPLVYRVVPREMDSLFENSSYVLMDPQHEYDIVKIVNPTFKIEESYQRAA